MNAVTLCPWSEPGYECEKGQGWHEPYDILRWGMEAAVMHRAYGGQWAKVNFLPTSDSGTSHIPLWRLQYPPNVGWSDETVERGDAWLDFLTSGRGTEYPSGSWHERKPGICGMLGPLVMG